VNTSHEHGAAFSDRRSEKLAHNRSLILAISCMGGFLVSFMASSVNIALPLMGEEFQASAVTLSWISLSYILIAAAVLLPLGRLADLYGRVRFFIYGMALFTVVAFASAFAPTAPVLLGLRAIHGISLAFASVTATSLVVLAYPPESRGKALGLSVAGVYLGLTLGPALGGLIIHNLGWRMLFVILGVLGLINLILPVWKLRGLDWREPKTARFDYLGSVIFAVSLPVLLLGFSFLPGVFGFALLVVGLAGLTGFVWWETRAADPLLHVDLLRRNRVFTSANGANFINYAATSAMIFLMSLYLQYNRGLTAQAAGLLLVVGAFFQTAAAPLAGRLADRVQARYVSAAGMSLSLLGLVAFIFLGAATPYWYIVAGLCAMGLGIAFFSSPNTYTITNSVAKSQVGIATATIGVMRNTGMSMSTGLATLVLAVVVGQGAIEPADYPQLLDSIRITFALFAVLCVFGVAASLVGPPKTGIAPRSRQDGTPGES
jgi:MFS family permease